LLYQIDNRSLATIW